jgi:multiple sugar transport system permease protein
MNTTVVASRPARGWSIKRIVSYVVLIAFALVFILPFVIAVVTSFKTRPDATANPLSLWPNPFTLEPWRRLFSSDQAQIGRWMFNTVFVAVWVTLGRVVFSCMAGYALARMRFRGRNVVFWIVIAVQAIPPIVLAIPRFIVLKQFDLIGTYPGIILPLMCDAMGIFLMKQFFEGIPYELEEAARIDGAGTFRTFFSVILPIARPGLITLVILSFQGAWNEFLVPLVASGGERDVFTLPLGLSAMRSAVGEGFDAPFLLAGSVITTIPVAIVFFVFQRYFVRGVATQGLKG